MEVFLALSINWNVRSMQLKHGKGNMRLQDSNDLSAQKINPSKIQVVISDIHGHYRALQQLKERLGYNSERHQLVYLGDYIDRGPQSWDVLQEVMREVREEEAIALKGNHEQLMVSVFSGDRSNMVNWLCNGGQKTLEDMNRKGDSSGKSEVLRFLDQLPLYAESEQYLYVHAGVNPEKIWEEQKSEDLLWIREKFIKATSLSLVTKKVVVFGHTPTISFCGKPGVYVGGDRIGVDTGVTAGLYLSAVEMDTLREYKVSVAW